jgi:hypothetical protein
VGDFSEGTPQVAVEPGTLEREGAFYHVRLRGELTSAWICSYLSLWAGLAFFSRFDLDVDKREISFPATAEPESSDTSSLLKIITAMLRLTTRRSRAA